MAKFALESWSLIQWHFISSGKQGKHADFHMDIYHIWDRMKSMRTICKDLSKIHICFNCTLNSLSNLWLFYEDPLIFMLSWTIKWPQYLGFLYHFLPDLALSAPDLLCVVPVTAISPCSGHAAVAAYSSESIQKVFWSTPSILERVPRTTVVRAFLPLCWLLVKLPWNIP